MSQSQASELVAAQYAAAAINKQTWGNILYNVKDKVFGAKGDGMTDDTVAIQSAINAAYAAGGGVVLFPSGSYLITRTMQLRSGVSLEGVDMFSATIRTGTTNLTMFSMVFGSPSGANLSIRNIHIYCTNTGVKGFQFTHCNQVHLDNVYFTGCFINAEFDRGGLNRIDNCVSAGEGSLKAGQLRMWSTDSSAYGCVFTHVNNYRINSGDGVQDPAIYFRRAVGIRLNNIITNDSDYTGTCFLFEDDCQGINIENSLIVGYGIGAHFLLGESATVPPNFCTFANVDFDQCAINAILIEDADYLYFNGGSVTSSAVGTETQAITVKNSASTFIRFSGMQVSGFYGSNGTAFYVENTDNLSIKDCVINECYNGISLGGSNTNLRIDSNSFNSCDFPIAGSVTGTGNEVNNNKGVLTSDKVVSPSFPASDVGVLNNFGYPARVFIKGGTVSIIKIDDQGAVYGDGMVLLKPGETIKVVYTGTPSWNWIAM